jgi:membrane protease YdiL (CAAX protease family)
MKKALEKIRSKGTADKLQIKDDVKRIYLTLEFFTIFALLPTLYVTDLIKINVIFLLLLVTLFCTFWLIRDKSFDKRKLWNLNLLQSKFRRILKVFLINSLILTTLVILFRQEMLFSFVKRAPLIWLMVVILYPLLSVYPQELIYRTFFFHRYRMLFPQRLSMIAASAAAFGYMHIVFENTVAVMMTLAGGFIFANTYDETRSTLAVWFEHSLYGCFVFTVGIGRYFYHGAVN